MPKGYDQFCPVAKASEVFANRWTPLILRELMAGMHGFNDIHRGVPLVSRAVLVTRLRELEDHGIVERRPRTGGAGDHEYWLTTAGEAFRPVVGALGHWGLVHGRDRIQPTDLDPTVFMWALRRRVDRDRLPEQRVVVQFEFAGVPANRNRFRTMWLVLERSGVDVCTKDPGYPVDVFFRGHIADFVAVYLGHAQWHDLGGKVLRIEGAAPIARRLPVWLRLDKRVGRDIPIVPAAAG
jgi:DNA-binding HxlR family transcriptional regulator